MIMTLIRYTDFEFLSFWRNLFREIKSKVKNKNQTCT